MFCGAGRIIVPGRLIEYVNPGGALRSQCCRFDSSYGALWPDQEASWYTWTRVSGGGSLKMIDLAEEQLPPLRNVPSRLPARSAGQRIHASTIYRWIQRGVRGVRLEAIRIGGTTYTSLEALQRFADRQKFPASQVPDPVNPVSRSRQKEMDAASRAADAILKGRDPSPRDRR